MEAGRPAEAPVGTWTPPPWGRSTGALALINIFGGGAVVGAGAAVSLWGMWTEYDGVLTLIGMVILPIIVAIPSALIVLVIGLPIRLVPPVRRWWLSHGEYTLIGAVGGFIVLIVGVVLARAGAEAGSPGVDGWQFLVSGWSVFCLSTMHFVWPRRWRRSAGARESLPPLSPAAAPAPPERMPRPR